MKTNSLEASGDFKGEKLVPEVPVDVNEVFKILPCRSLTSRRVEKRSGLSLEGFLRDYFLTSTPVVIANCMAHWSARTKWNHLDYLRAVAGNRTVPVEYSPFMGIEKGAVLQEARVFNDSQVDPRRCSQVITKLLYLLNQGE